MSRGVTPARALLQLAVLAVLACLYPPILWGVAIALGEISDIERVITVHVL